MPLGFLKRKYLGLTVSCMMLAMAGHTYANNAAFDPEENCAPCELENGNPCRSYAVRADLLYWRALQGGLHCGCGPTVKDRWDLGSRVGIKWDSLFCGWDASVYWTRLHNRSHNGHHGEKAHWKLKYDTIDLFLNREIYSNNCLSINPYVGLRGVRLDEKLKSNYSDCQSCADEIHLLFNKDIRQKFWGFGPQLGLNGQWNLGCGFSLFGNLGVGLLYGHFDIHLHQIEYELYSDEDCCCRIGRSVRACQLFGDASVGIQWEKCLCENVTAILRVSLEHHRYFNHNQISNYGDLCLDGVTFSAGLKF